MPQPKDIRLAKWIKNKTHIYAVYETHFKPSDTNRLKVKGWKMIFHTHGNPKRAVVAILISDKIDFKIKTVTRDEDVNCIMIKRSIQEE